MTTELDKVHAELRSCQAEDVEQILKHASASVQADREVVMAAVRKNVNALRFASSNLRADKEIVCEAVRNTGKATGKALVYASTALRADRGLVEYAVRQNLAEDCGFEFADESLRSDRTFMCRICRIRGALWRYAPDEFRNDKQLLLDVVSSDEGAFALEHVSQSLRVDEDVAIAALNHSRCFIALECIPLGPRLVAAQALRDEAIEFLQSDGRAFHSLSSGLQVSVIYEFVGTWDYQPHNGDPDVIHISPVRSGRPLQLLINHPMLEYFCMVDIADFFSGGSVHLFGQHGRLEGSRIVWQNHSSIWTKRLAVGICDMDVKRASSELCLPVEAICFSQDSISGTFRDGQYLGKMFEELKLRSKDLKDIPQIRVVSVDGRWHSLDNRRLWVFKQALPPGTQVPVLEVSHMREDPQKLRDFGQNVELRTMAAEDIRNWLSKPGLLGLL